MTQKITKHKNKAEDCPVCECDTGASEIGDIEAEVEDWDKDVIKR